MATLGAGWSCFRGTMELVSIVAVVQIRISPAQLQNSIIAKICFMGRRWRFDQHLPGNKTLFILYVENPFKS